MLRPLPSLNVLALAAGETLKISLPTIVQAAAGTLSVSVCNERLDSWSRRLLSQAGLTFDVVGQENIRAGEGYVVMSNHQSHYDIPTLFQALKIPMRMVAKKEIFQIPFMSRAMRAAGFVEVDRKNSRNAISTLSAAKDTLPESMSIWIAPEGTRSKTGRMGPFKKGGFHLAVKTGMRILPVSIDGTRRTLPSGGLTVHRGNRVRITISPPIDPKTYGSERFGDLISDVRNAIVGPLPPEFRPESS